MSQLMNNENINYDLSCEKMGHTYFPCEIE